MKRPPLPKVSLFSRLGLALTSLLAVAAGFVLASLLFTILLAVGLVAGGWLWWRHRRSTRAAAPDFIDADYTIEFEHPALQHRQAPPAAVPDRPETPPRRER